jgi:GNAT superfamily N-acetyltransferase
MAEGEEVQFRSATRADAAAIAGLHAESWRVHYRGAYTDAYLDGDIDQERLAVWSQRFAGPDPRARTVLAEWDGRLVGFAHTILDHDPIWGALVDNLHVVAGLKRHGIGRRLLAHVGRTVLDETPGKGLYLWVLEQNTAAQAFYTARGGRCVERDDVPPPGEENILNGSPACLRFVWPDPARLLH